jgi:hypothetical protein
MEKALSADRSMTRCVQEEEAERKALPLHTRKRQPLPDTPESGGGRAPTRSYFTAPSAAIVPCATAQRSSRPSESENTSQRHTA